MAGRCVSRATLVGDEENFGDDNKFLCKKCADKEGEKKQDNSNIPKPSGISEEELEEDIRKLKSEQGGFFAAEKKGMQKGVLGGIIMMVIAVVWFVVGYIVGYIFYYPLILFIIGLFAFLKGLFTGNLAGKKEK